MPDSSDVSMPCWPGVLVGDSFRGHLSTSGFRTHTLCFGHLRVGVPLFSFRLLVPLAFFSPLFDASSHRATRLSGLLLSLSCLSVSVFVIAATHSFARNAPSPSGLTVGL